MTKTTCYKTDDGSFFDNDHNAKMHESGIALMSILIEEGQVCSLVAKKHEKFGDIITRAMNQNIITKQ